jgi:hypothetical protein
MALEQPPIQEFTADDTGRFPQVWLRWFLEIASYLSGEKPIKLQPYTVSGVPAANENTGSIIYISDESGGAIIAFSDGVNWRRSTDRAIVS